MAVGKQQTMKAQLTRASLIVAAAAILREDGPSSVTYRRVAQKAGAASSSVGYYFESIDALLREAADFNMRLWSQRAEKAAQDAEELPVEECRERLEELLLQACLPEDFTKPAAHYEQLMTASESLVVTAAYRRGRLRLDGAIERILEHAGYSGFNPRMVVALVDGAAVQGISEGYSVREAARNLLTEALAMFKA
jgi:DNA-binding transcriptional regulator YbjK